MDDTEDDLTVKDTDGLLRRIPNIPDMYKYDHNKQCRVITSICFSDRESNGTNLSVTQETPLFESGGTHEDALGKFKNFGLARFTADIVRNHVNTPQKIIIDPTPEDPHHAIVFGKKNKKVQRQIKKQSELLIAPKMDADY